MGPVMKLFTKDAAIHPSVGRLVGRLQRVSSGSSKIVVRSAAKVTGISGVLKVVFSCDASNGYVANVTPAA